MRWHVLPTSRFEMGTDDPDVPPQERPARSVTVGVFEISTDPVTCAEFGAFVDGCRARTTAEVEGSGFVWAADGSLTLTGGATWRNPTGDGAEPADDAPVTQVSFFDALEYCRWAGVALPTEAQWARANRELLFASTDAWTEWTADFHDPDFHRTEQRVNPTGPPTGHTRVVRGGERPTQRSGHLPDMSASNLTFRVVRPVRG